jgi:tetratricopeptide (TPR) repeat protein
VISIWGFYELLIQVVDNHLEVPTDTYHVKTCFEHRNLLAQVLLLTFIFQLSESILAKRKWLSITFFVTATLNLFLLVVLSNRAVWLAGIISLSLLVMLISLLILKYRNSDFKQLKLGLIKLSAIVTLALLISFSFFQVYALKDKMIGHASSVIDMQSGSGEDRIELWKRTLDNVSEKPIIGHGLANWKIEILKYGNSKLLSEDNLTFYQRPHNDFLWMASEAGMIGLILYLLIYLFTIVTGLSLLYKEKRPENQLFLSMVLSAITGYLVFSFFSFPMERVVQNTFITLLIACILIYSYESGRYSSTRGKAPYRAVWIVATLIGIAAVVTGVFRFVGEANLKKALVSKDQQAYHQLITDIDRASNRLYEMEPTSTPLAWYSGFAYYQQDDYQTAIEHFQDAYKTNPYHVHVLNNLGSSYSKEGNSDSAILYYEKALEIAPNFEESRLNLSAVLYNSGNADMAYEVIREIDYSSDDPRYRLFLTSILQSKIKSLFPDDSIPDLPTDENWYVELHKMAVDDSTSVEKLIFDTGFFIQQEHPKHE